MGDDFKDFISDFFFVRIDFVILDSLYLVLGIWVWCVVWVVSDCGELGLELISF